MSILEKILYPILPEEDRDIFFAFLESVATDVPSWLFITGDDNTGKSTLARLAVLFIGKKYTAFPGSHSFTTVTKTRYPIFSQMSSLLCVFTIERPENYEVCFNRITEAIKDPENYLTKHYIVVGDFQKPKLDLDPSKYSHIHLDNDIPKLCKKEGKKIEELLCCRDKIKQEMTDQVINLRSQNIKG